MQKITESLMERNSKQGRADKILTACIVAFALLIVVVLFLNTVVYVTVKVDGSSMNDTLQDGDILSVNKIKSVKRGDIVVIQLESGTWLIKRAIGLAGDVVEITFNGEVKLNGLTLSESYIKGTTYPIIGVGSPQTRWVVGEGEIFFLGDNRQNSADSRVYGVKKLDSVIGVVEGWSVALRGVRNQLYLAFDVVSKLFGGNGCAGASAEGLC